jgi:hypothetical protein
MKFVKIIFNEIVMIAEIWSLVCNACADRLGNLSPPAKAATVRFVS